MEGLISGAALRLGSGGVEWTGGRGDEVMVRDGSRDT